MAEQFDLDVLRETLRAGLAKKGLELLTWRTDPDSLELRYRAPFFERTIHFKMKPILDRLQEPAMLPVVLGREILNHAGIFVEAPDAPVCIWCSEPLELGDETAIYQIETTRGVEGHAIHAECLALVERLQEEDPGLQCEPCWAPLQARPPNPELRPVRGLVYCSRCGGPYRI